MTYAEAYDVARELATQLGQPYGIEKSRYTAGGFKIFMLPKSPANRFGHELRCEVVEPGSPRVERRP